MRQGSVVRAFSKGMECDPILWLQSDRPSTASTADAADLDVPSIAKEVAELLLSSLTRFPEERAGESTNVIAPASCGDSS